VSRLQQDLSQAQRRAAEIERVREAEQVRQRRDEQQLHDELQELRAQNSTLRGDEQFRIEEVEALRDEITRLRQSNAAAGAAAGAGAGASDGDVTTAGEGDDSTSDAERGASSPESNSAVGSVQMGPQQAVLEAELKQLRLDHQQALADAERDLQEEKAEHSVEKRRLEEMLAKTARKNRELTARLESIDSSASSHEERMKELTDENRALMKEKNDSVVEAATVRKELERANAEIEQQDRQIQELEAEKGDTHDQMNLLTQQVAKLRQEKDSVSAELEAALDNAGEVTTSNTEALAALKAQLKAQQDDAEAKRALAEAARAELETKVRQALMTAKQNQDRLEADNARLKALVQHHGGGNA
jgi:chromosome segregation ATPase